MRYMGSKRRLAKETRSSVINNNIHKFESTIKLLLEKDGEYTVSKQLVKYFIHQDAPAFNTTPEQVDRSVTLDCSPAIYAYWDTDDVMINFCKNNGLSLIIDKKRFLYTIRIPPSYIEEEIIEVAHIPFSEGATFQRVDAEPIFEEIRLITEVRKTIRKLPPEINYIYD